MKDYAAWLSRVVWLGIGVNIFFAAALCFFPDRLLALLNMQIPIPIIWVRTAGLLLFEISILQIPVALASYSYEATGWMLVLVSRGCGALFFLCAVLLFGQAWGFLTIALVDLIFGVIGGVLLFLARRAQQTAVPETSPEPAQ